MFYTLILFKIQLRQHVVIEGAQQDAHRQWQASKWIQWIKKYYEACLFLLVGSQVFFTHPVYVAIISISS